MQGYDADAHFNRQQQALYDRFTQFTLLAAREAIAQSGLEFSGRLAAEAGVILGTLFLRCLPSVGGAARPVLAGPEEGSPWRPLLSLGHHEAR